MKTIINSYDEFATYIGKELGTSEWLKVDQDRINAFADATLDHQWIHVDVERAQKARTKARSRTVISRSPCCPISGTRSWRSTTLR